MQQHTGLTIVFHFMSLNVWGGHLWDFNNRQTQAEVQVQSSPLGDATHSQTLSWYSRIFRTSRSHLTVCSSPAVLHTDQIQWPFNLYLSLSLCSIPLHPSMSLEVTGPSLHPSSPACSTAVVTQHWPVLVTMTTIPPRKPQHPQKPQGDSQAHKHAHTHSTLEACF